MLIIFFLNFGKIPLQKLKKENFCKKILRKIPP